MSAHIRIKPLFTTSHGALFDADCLDILSRMRDECVDTVFADPPFNIGKDYKTRFNDSITKEAYLSWCRAWILECCRIIKPGGAFFLYSTPELAVQFAPILGESLAFRHWIAMTMKGSFPVPKRLYPAHYAMLYYTKGGQATFNKLRIPIVTCRHCKGEIRDYGGHRDKMHADGVNLSDFWDDTSPNRHKGSKIRQGVNELKFIIPERAILISTEPKGFVFDPFGGGGSTYQAAEKYGRFWLGTEKFDSANVEARMVAAFPGSANKTPAFDLTTIFDK